MIRRKAMDEVRGLSDVEKDDVKRLERRVQQMTDSYVDDISSALQNKISAIDSLRGS